MQLLGNTLAVLYALAVLVLLAYGLNLLWMAVRFGVGERLWPGLPPDPDALPDGDAAWPEITVQIPLYNEPSVASRVIDACARLAYSKGRLEIQVLDDSTDETSALVEARVAYWRARGVDICHVHRSNRDGYKAGALRNGLRLARGSVIAIFDADFEPQSDFLLRAVPPLMDDPGLGLVQARWGHLNADASRLTRLQAMGLDAHFAVEQRVRGDAGCFINFNGTAGVWRRACIEAAGGWHADTLAEDLDLSYRAQLAGWRLKYLPAVEAPAELPPDSEAFRGQQHRWTKGTAETAVKLLGPLWRSAQPARVKVEGTLHLTAPLVFPVIVLSALVHPPLMVLQRFNMGPGPAFYSALGLGLLGLAGFLLTHAFAQRELYPDWSTRLRLFPLFMAGSTGMAVNNARAVWEALRGKRSAFVRTPKYSEAVAANSGRRVTTGKAGRIPMPEAWMTLYAAAGLAVLAAHGAWAALPLQVLYVAGFGMVAASHIPRTDPLFRSRRAGLAEPASRAYL